MANHEATIIRSLTQDDGSAVAGNSDGLCSVCQETFRDIIVILRDADEYPADQADFERIRARHSQVTSFTYVQQRGDLTDITIHLPHHKTWSAVLDASDHGCQICSLLRHTPAQTHGRGKGAPKYGASLGFQYRRMDLSTTLVQRSCVAFSWQASEATSHLSRGPFEISTLAEYLYLPARMPSSSPPVDYINGWIETCRQSHSKSCTSNIVGLPTRLHKIKRCAGALSIHLVQTTEHMIGAVEYVALSHCWGEKKPHTLLLSSNIEEHVAGLLVNDLPATFRDAVRICHGLDYNYLWIDSLCIIQDDANDWRHECSRMADVYSGAAFTLAASSARNASDGFLTSRDSLGVTSHLNLRMGDGELLPLVIRTLDVDDPGPFDDRCRPRPSTLATRAWALQERLLSARYVSFAKYQISMTCRCAIFAERCLIPAMLTGDYTTTKAQIRSSHSQRLIATVIDHSNFHQVVAEFTRRRITFADDRLPAFSALARQYHQHEVGHYYAGLRSTDMIEDLLWSAETSIYAEINNDLPARLTIPSWSWASCETSVNFRSGQHGALSQPLSRVEATTLAVDVKLVGEDPYGQVKGGSITISAKTFPCSTYTAMHSDRPSRLRLASLLGEAGQFFAKVSMDRLPANGYDDGSVYIGILLQVVPAVGEGGKEEWHGLLLDRSFSVQGSEDTFRRVGTITNRGIDQSMWQRKTGLFPKCELARLLAAETRTVTIV